MAWLSTVWHLTYLHPPLPRYIPTIGACLCLTACLLVVVGDTRHLLASPRWLPSCGQPTVGRVVAAIARVLVVCAVLAAAAACTAATTRRTQDWVTDETLFVSALDVCGTSAKHHYQLGLVSYAPVPLLPLMPGLTDVVW